jgi:hypothetical protein
LFAAGNISLKENSKRGPYFARGQKNSFITIKAEKMFCLDGCLLLANLLLSKSSFFRVVVRYIFCQLTIAKMLLPDVYL